MRLSQSVKEVETSFLDYLKKMTAYNEAIALMGWDLRTGAPKKGVEQRSEVIGQLSEDVFQMSVSDEMKSYIDQLSENQDELSEITKKSVEECKKEYDRNTKIPAKEYREFV
ncbi:MAG TPA: carboxypeptidase M32, partial [Bacillales bacterium]